MELVNTVHHGSSFLHRLILDTRDAANLDEALSVALADVCTATGWIRGELWIVDGDQLRLGPTYDAEGSKSHRFAEVSATTTFRRGEGLPGRVWEANAPIWLSDFSAQPFKRSAFAVEARFRAAVAIPVSGETGTFAVMAFFLSEAEPENSALVDLIGVVASHLTWLFERREAERALRESEERYRDLFENATDLIQSVDGEGRILFVNQAWQRTLGYTADEASRMQMWEIIHPDSMAHCIELFERALSGHNPGRMEVRFLTRHGQEVFVEGNVNAKYVDGRLAATRAIFRDVTEQKTQQRELLAARNRLQAVLDAATEVSIIATALDGTILLFNRGAERMLGYRADEMVGLCTPEKIHLRSEVEQRGRELSEQFGRPIAGYDAFVELARRGIAEEREWTYCTKGGDQLTVSLVVTPVLGADGDISGFLGLARNVTQQKRAESALRTSEETLRSIVTNSLSGLVTVDERGFVTSFNPAARRIFGYDAADSISGLHVSALIPLEWLGPDGSLRQAHQRAIGRVTERTGRRKNGDVFPIELALFEFRTASGRQFAGHVVDISGRREVERLKQEFISTVSHELRTPLTSMLGSLDLLLAGVLGELTPDASELIEIAQRNAARLIALINDILDLDRLESGRLQMHAQRVRLRDIGRTAVEAVSSFAAREGIVIDLRLPDVEVFADEGRICQVLVNLVSNAIKFSPRASRVTVDASVADTMATISVIDHGRGIPSAFLGRIFERFEQVEAGDARKNSGSGLGLAICRLIVEQHGGTIGVESTEGEGSRFWFTLPRNGESA